MKKIAGIFLLILASYLFTGCIVQSLHPFYKEEALIELPQLEGEWLLLKDAGDDVSKKKIRPWILSSDKIHTFDEKGISSILKVKYFKIDGTIFIDIMPDNPDGERLNQWWYFHVVPVHSVSKVTIKDGSLIINPLSYEWIEDSFKTEKISLPHIKLESAGLTVFNVDPETWMTFLKKYKDNKDAFPEKLEYVLKISKRRQRRSNKGAYMKAIKSKPEGLL